MKNSFKLFYFLFRSKVPEFRKGSVDEILPHVFTWIAEPKKASLESVRNWSISFLKSLNFVRNCSNLFKDFVIIFSFNPHYDKLLELNKLFSSPDQEVCRQALHGLGDRRKRLWGGHWEGRHERYYRNPFWHFFNLN